MFPLYFTFCFVNLNRFKKKKKKFVYWIDWIKHAGLSVNEVCSLNRKYLTDGLEGVMVRCK